MQVGHEEFRKPLGLDLGGTTGFAYYDKKLIWGSRPFTTKDEGPRSYLPACNLKHWIESQDFTAIAFEETFARGAAKLRLDSMQTVCAIHCLERRLPWARISASGLKKFATGNGRCGKEQMVEAAKYFYPEIGDRDITYDEADAICVLAWFTGLSRGME